MLLHIPGGLNTLIFTPPMICNIVKYQSEVRPEVCPLQFPVIISCQHFLILPMVLISCVHHLPSSSQYYSHAPQNLVVVDEAYAFILVNHAGPTLALSIHQPTRTVGSVRGRFILWLLFSTSPNLKVSAAEISFYFPHFCYQ